MYVETKPKVLNHIPFSTLQIGDHAMKKLLNVSLVALLMAAPPLVSAQMDMQPYQGSTEFERLTGLVGVWEGEMPMQGKGGEGMPEDHANMMQKIRVSYQLTAGGSALLETFAAGTPMEMVSVYHDRGGKLSMTHYCMLGNQPRMELQSSEEGKMMFTFSQDNEVECAKGMHMHSMAMSMVDKDTIVQRWTMYQGDEAQPAHDIPDPSRVAPVLVLRSLVAAETA
jgi:hypothetical protein